MSDERGLSVAVNYVLILGIVALLTTGLFVSTGTFVEGQQDRAVRSSLQVVGNRIAADLAAVDRISRTFEGNGTVSATVRLPDTFAGVRYRGEIEPLAAPNLYGITLTSTNPRLTVRVRVKSRTPVASGTFYGDHLVIRYDPIAGELVVTNA